MSVTQATLLGDTFGSKASGTIPIGGIIMWSGSVASVPTGWSICNGANGTPNLVDRFIVGAGSGYAVAATGGSANATLVAHTHTISDPGHAHTYLVSTQGGAREDTPLDNFIYRSGAATSSNTTGITINSSGSSGTNANLPPYYALAFIMRTS